MARVLLGVSASVSLYKACDLASKLRQEGHAVRAILTRRAAELVSPQLFEAITGERAATSEFGSERDSAMDHIELARFGDALVVAPASADLVAKLAHGMADDLLTTVALALPASKPRLLCPAMNPVMWSASALQRNVTTLVEDGWKLVEPAAGHMACGDEGLGRLAEPAQIQAALRAALGTR